MALKLGIIWAYLGDNEAILIACTACESGIQLGLLLMRPSTETICFVWVSVGLITLFESGKWVIGLNNLRVLDILGVLHVFWTIQKRYNVFFLSWFSWYRLVLHLLFLVAAWLSWLIFILCSTKTHRFFLPVLFLGWPSQSYSQTFDFLNQMKDFAFVHAETHINCFWLIKSFWVMILSSFIYEPSTNLISVFANLYKLVQIWKIFSKTSSKSFSIEQPFA